MDSLFDPLLSLEDEFYREGYARGLSDGEEAGRLEGRTFGLQKGYEKFLELGRLQGRCSVWKARIPAGSGPRPSVPPAVEITHARTQKNVEALATLLADAPFRNDEESVDEVDETLRRGRAKARMLERVLGERERHGTAEADGGNIEDAGRGGGARLQVST